VIVGDEWFIVKSNHSPSNTGVSCWRRRTRYASNAPTKFLNRATLREMFVFGKDIVEVPVDVSTLDRPAILSCYLSDWKQWE
jgi:predicted membrane-bound spermidine synthase